MSGEQLVGLHVYPLKSARGVACETAVAEQRGLRHDRRWMIVDQDGEFLTQRSEPRLATLTAALPDGPLGDDGSIVLQAEGRDDLPVSVPENTAARLPATIWRDRIEAQVAGGEANAWLSELLGRTVWLAYMPDDARRPTELAPQFDVSLADGYPYLLCNTASLRDLNGRLEEPVPMERFRANLVVDVHESWAEDSWRRLRIGDVEFEAVKPCARCVVTTTDQVSGECRGPEPLATLVRFRRDKKGKALFGMNLVALGDGVLRMGDPLEILA